MHSSERRASLQDGIFDTNRAILTFSNHQLSILKTIFELTKTSADIFANNEIRKAALTLLDHLNGIEKELEQAGDLLQPAHADDFLDTDLGQRVMQNPRTATMIRGMCDGAAKASSELKSIQYTSSIQHTDIQAINPPNLTAIIQSLEVDIKKAMDIHLSIAQLVAANRREWSDIKKESAKGQLGYDPKAIEDPSAIRVQEWHQTHCQTSPFSGKDLDGTYITSYNKAMVNAIDSMPQPSINGTVSPLPHQEERTNANKDYEQAIIAYFNRLDPLDRFKDFPALDLPDDVKLRWTEVKKSFSLLEKLRNETLRLCGFGLFNEGKSSFLNALVGKRILFSDDGQATAWPIIVRHDTSRKEPILRIAKNSLDPFLSLLREIRFSDFIDPQHPRHAIVELRHKAVLVKEMTPGEQASLRQFEDPTFAFEPEIQNTKERPHAIMDTVDQINRLVRFCWQYRTSSKPLPIASNAWPVISVEFAFFAGEQINIELLDCPGSGEAEEAMDNPENAGSEMPDLILETSLRSCLDGAFSIVKHASASATPWHSLLNNAQSWTDRRPLAVYLTHQDSAGGPKGKKAILVANRKAYTTKLNGSHRVHLCSPSMSLDTYVVLNRIGVDVVATTKAKREDEPFLPGDLPPEAPSWATIAGSSHESSSAPSNPDAHPAPASVAPPAESSTLPTSVHQQSAFKLIWGEGVDTLRDAEITYRTGGYDSFKRVLSTLWTRYNFVPVAEHFRSRAVQDGFDRRQFRQLCLASRAMEDLLRAQKDLINFTLSRERDFPQQKASYEKFEHGAKFQLGIWKKMSWAARKAEAAITLKTRLEATRALAQKQASQAVMEAIDEMHLTERTGLPGLITVVSPLDRTNFLALVYKRLLSRAIRIQKDHVDAIREEAAMQWSSLMHSLASEISKFGPEISPYAQDEIVAVLRNAATEMETTTYSYLIEIAKKRLDAAMTQESTHPQTPVPTMSPPESLLPIDRVPNDLDRVSKERNAMTRENLPFRLACAEAQGRTIDEGHLNNVTRLVARGLDKSGFVFRPCIPVSLSAANTTEEWIWDDAASPGDGSTVQIETLTTNVIKGFVEPWLSNLAKESECSLDGTSGNAEKIATVAIEGFLKRRGEYLQKPADYTPPSVSDGFIRDLIAWHASCSVFYGIIRKLCSGLFTLMDPCLLPVLDPSAPQAKSTSIHAAGAKATSTGQVNQLDQKVDDVTNFFYIESEEAAKRDRKSVV